MDIHGAAALIKTGSTSSHLDGKMGETPRTERDYRFGGTLSAICGTSAFDFIEWNHLETLHSVLKSGKGGIGEHT